MHDDLLRALFANGPQPILLLDRARRVVDANDAFCAWVGRARELIVGRDPIDAMDETSRAAELARRAAARSAQGDAIECVVLGRDGVPLRACMRETVLRDPDGGTVGVATLFDPIEAQLRQLRPVAEQADRMQKFFDMAPVGCVIRDDQGRVVCVNRAYTEMSGYAESDLVGSTTMQVPRAQEPALIEAMWRHLLSAPEKIERTFGTLLTKGGRELRIERMATWIEGSGGRRYRMTTVSDITQRSIAEEELRQLVQQQGALLRSISAGVMLVVGDRVVRCNPSLETLLGMPADRIIGQPVGQILRADRTWTSIREAGCEAVRRAAEYRCELEVQRPDQGAVSCVLQLRGVDSADVEAGQIVTLQDITEINRQQSSLRKANAELAALVENTAVAIAYLDGHRVVRANRLMENLLGFQSGGLPGRALAELLPQDDGAAAELLGALSDPARRSCTVATKLRRVADDPVSCLVHVGPVDKIRWPSASILVAIDMSGQEAALSALADSQERFGRFADALQEAVFVIDSQRQSALYANSRLERVLCVSPEAFYRNPDAAWRHVDPQDRGLVDDLLEHAHAPGRHEADIRVIGPDGVGRIVRLRLFTPRPGSKELYALAEDVTESRHSAQRRLDEAIQQRETLIREVHHRIKNNLQGVAGLLQQAATRRPEIAPQLEEIVGQIQAIAQVHGLQVRDRGDMSAARLVRAVLDNLSRGFGRTIAYPTEQFAALDGWVIPEQEAVPLALVVNELGTNAIKHRTGDDPVTADLRIDADRLVLTIRNPGSLPPGFSLFRLDPTPTGLRVREFFGRHRGRDCCRCLTWLPGRRVELRARFP